MPETWYAWCFSHGRLHADAWCTASWVRLRGNDEASALADKHARYGDARFIDELPLEVQAAIEAETEVGRG